MHTHTFSEWQITSIHNVIGTPQKVSWDDYDHTDPTKAEAGSKMSFVNQYLPGAELVDHASKKI